MTVAALLSSMFMSAMEATVVGTAMPTVVAELGGVALYGWVTSSYLLASTVSVPIYGKVSDLYGRKRILILGISLFLIGSLTSGLAHSIPELIVARAIQGLGAGAMQPVSLTIVGDLFTIEERGRIQGLFGAVWATAGISGPLVGGTLVHLASWRWVFWINIPFGLLSIVMLRKFYVEPSMERTRRPFDFLGAGALIAGATTTLLAASGNQWAFFIAAVSLVVFVYAEQRAADPVLPLSLIRGRAMAVAVLSGAFLGATMMGSLMLVPLYAQGALGRAPAEAGATVAPMLIGWPIASALTSRFLVKTGFRPPVWLGSGLIALALLGFVVSLGPSVAAGRLELLMFVYGFGMGLTNTALLIAVQASVEWNRRGVATALSLFARSMGGALGTGVLGAGLAASLTGRLSPEVVTGLLDPHTRGSLASPEVAAALGEALVPLFWVVAALGAFNLLAIALYPRVTAENAARS